MPRTILRAAAGEQQTDSLTGPSSYDSGTGFTIDTDLQRVNDMMVASDNNSWEARVASTTDNSAVVQVYSQSTNVEAPSGQDLSSVSFVYNAAQT